MTRRASILAYSLAIALGLLGLQSWSVAVGRIQQRVVAAIEQGTGLVVTGMERAEIALLPLPRISLSQVSFAQRDGAVSGSAVRIRARARLFSLFTGRFAFDRIELVAPQIDVAVTDQDDTLGEWLTPALTFLANVKSQSKIAIASGSVFIRANGAIRTVLRDVNLFVEERETDAPLALAGSVNWRGVPTELSLTWPMTPERARTVLAVTSPLLKLRFEGGRTGVSEPVTNGLMSLSTPSLTELLGWFGEQPRLASAIGTLTLNANAQIKPHEVSLSNAVATLDGDRLDGAIKLGDAGGRLALSGTLAGAELDLGRLVARLQLPPLASSGDAPLTFDNWTAQDIDLRVSVDAAKASGARLADVATYLLVKKGRFEAGLLRATAYGGSARGRFLAVVAPSGIDVKLQAGLDKVDFTAAAGDAAHLVPATGLGGLQVTLDGVGRTVDEVIASFSGRASLVLRQGEIGGLALADLMRRSERGGLPATRDWRQGRTAFDALAVHAGIANGIVVPTEAQMSGQGYKLVVTGNAALPTRWLDLSAVLSNSSGSLKLPLAIKGPFGAPVVAPEPESLLRPIGNGSAPLLLTR